MVQVVVQGFGTSGLEGVLLGVFLGGVVLGFGLFALAGGRFIGFPAAFGFGAGGFFASAGFGGLAGALFLGGTALGFGFFGG